MDASIASTLEIFDDLVKLPCDLQTAFLESRHTDTAFSSTQTSTTSICCNSNGVVVAVQDGCGPWRLKERMKTVSVALVLCLNIGIDPPDILKTQPCAKLECWFDPTTVTPQKAIEHIGNLLEKYYERWQAKARYKKSLDPTRDELKKLCTSMRRNAKDDRVLFHYNGHGVPKPTAAGEIWAFNNNYTVYMPLPINELHSWIGSPSVYVFDCSCAGAIVEAFQAHARDYKRKYLKQQQQQRQESLIRDSLSRTRLDESLNQANDDDKQQQHQQQRQQQQNYSNMDHNLNPSANLGNATTTISPTSGTVLYKNGTNYEFNNVNKHLNNHHQISNQQSSEQKAQNNQNGQQSHETPKYIDYENSIHLAACAANQILPMNPDLPADLFTSCLTTPLKIALRWFIQQNYDKKLIAKIELDLVDRIPGTLADRRTMLGEMNWIFTAVTDTIAWNVLPLEQFHRLFRQDLLVASLFRNFLLAERIMRTYNCTPVSLPKLPPTHHHKMWKAWDMVVDLCLSQLPAVLNDHVPFKTSSFFAEQLTAFEVWLDLNHTEAKHPEQLPIVLQVLLSPVHRLRALDLLCKFLNLGSWAVFSALSVGIFPYVLKLLQSSARDVKPFLVTIWAKILANDISVRADLVREGYHRYFLCILSDSSYSSNHRTLAAYVMTCIVRDYPPGQEAAFKGSLIAFCLEQINDSDANLRKWATICLGCSWNNYEDARWCGVRDSAHEKLYILLQDPNPEVRTAAVMALGTFINSSCERTDHANTIDQSIGMKLVSTVLYDSSVLVRYELVIALQYLILAFELQFIQLEGSALECERRRDDDSAPNTPPSINRVHNNTIGFLSPTAQNNLSRHSTRLSTSYTRNYEPSLNHTNTNNINNSQHQSPVNLTPVNSILRVNSLNSIPLNFNSGSKIVSNVYQVIWKAMHTLAHDPHPKIATSAQAIIDEIRSRLLSSAMSNESLKESKSNSSFSEPSSPNATSFSIADLPNNIGSFNDLQQQDRQNQIDEWATIKNLAQQNICLRELPLADPSKFNDNVTPVKAPHGANLILFHPTDPIMFVASRDEFSVFHIDLMNAQSNNNHSTFNNCATNQLNSQLLNNHHLHSNSASSLHNSSSSGGGLHCAASAMLSSSTVSSITSRYSNNNTNSNWRLLGTQCNNLTGSSASSNSSSSSFSTSGGSKMMMMMKNGNAGSARITSIQLINPHDQTLLLTGTNEGAVRIWRPYNSADLSFNQQLISAFYLMPELQPQRKSLGMVLLWQQQQTRIYATSDQNDVRVIKVWDASSERKVQEIPTCAEFGVSCLSSNGENSIAAGFLDGSIRIYDTRLKKTDCRTFTYRQHTEKILNLHLFKPNEKHINLVSGDISGEVRFWDNRAPSSVKRVCVGQKMTTMDVHQHADLFACGLASQEIKIYTLDGTSKAESVIKTNDHFFASQKSNKLSTLSFHPLKASLAVGLNDGSVSIYSTRSISTH